MHITQTIEDGDYVTFDQIKEMLTTVKYVVTSYFSSPIFVVRHDAGGVAEVLYKGDSETDAKKAWLEDKNLLSEAALCNILFDESGVYYGCEHDSCQTVFLNKVE